MGNRKQGLRFCAAPASYIWHNTSILKRALSYVEFCDMIYLRFRWKAFPRGTAINGRRLAPGRELLPEHFFVAPLHNERGAALWRQVKSLIFSLLSSAFVICSYKLFRLWIIRNNRRNPRKVRRFISLLLAGGQPSTGSAPLWFYYTWPSAPCQWIYHFLLPYPNCKTPAPWISPKRGGGNWNKSVIWRLW